MMRDDLRRLVRGDVLDDAATRASVSSDFGQLIARTPAVVVRPQDARDVAAVLRYASARGIAVSSRGAGHSMHGQSLNDGGITLDLRSLDAVEDVRGGAITAGAGATWKSVVDAALQHDLLPPVLTYNLWATIGGTHASGGIGTMSWRHGSQADNCLGLEVVTADGEIVWCEPGSDLFRYTLCGLGQLSVMTKVRHAIGPIPPANGTRTFVHDDVEPLLAHMRLVVEMNAAVAIAARAEDGHFVLDVVNESVLGTQPPPRFDAAKAHPWIDALMPWSAAAEYVRAILAMPLPSYVCHYALWPLRRDRLRLPLLVTPDADLLLGVSILPVVPRAELIAAMETIRAASALCIAMGGKRYLAGWFDFDDAGWREHFGSEYEPFARLKRELDPRGILNPR